MTCHLASTDPKERPEARTRHIRLNRHPITVDDNIQWHIADLGEREPVTHVIRLLELVPGYEGVLARQVVD